jgi:hypothetical protein
LEKKSVDEFARLPAGEKRGYFEIASDKAGNMGEHILEKDFWVCWTLKRLFELPSLKGHVIFKGGTSLSKVFHVIERFSEDIDISLSKDLLGFGGDKDPEKAGGSKKRAQAIDELALACREYVTTELHASLKGTIETALKTTSGWSLEIDPADPDGQTLLFEYPAATEAVGRYVEHKVKIEIGARSDHWPAHERNIRPYVADYIPDAFAESDAQVKTLDAARTFWEKATILHAYAHYPEAKTPAARQARHYYDFYKLLRTKHKAEALQELDLLARVAEHKSIYFRAAWARYEDAKPGTLKLTPGGRIEAVMRRDYELMAEMFFGEAPGWKEIVEAIRAFEAEFNADT